MAREMARCARINELALHFGHFRLLQLAWKISRHAYGTAHQISLLTRDLGMHDAEWHRDEEQDRTEPKGDCVSQDRPSPIPRAAFAALHVPSFEEAREKCDERGEFSGQDVERSPMVTVAAKPPKPDAETDQANKQNDDGPIEICAHGKSRSQEGIYSQASFALPSSLPVKKLPADSAGALPHVPVDDGPA
jgi:hypothetical protein